MPKRREVQERTPGSPTPGGFGTDGSWVRAASPDNALTRTVRDLRRARQAGISPASAASLIEQRGFSRAFPNLEQWRTALDWYAAHASTAAESTVRLSFCVRVGDYLEPAAADEAESGGGLLPLDGGA